MRQQKMEFFRAVRYSTQTGDTAMVTQSGGGDIVNREILYDPNQPYSPEEWEFARRTYRNVKIYGGSGAVLGTIGGYAIIHFCQFNRGRMRSPLWIRILFLLPCAGFGSVLTMKLTLNQSMTELQDWTKPGRLLQERKYVLSWINSDDKQREEMQNKVRQKSNQLN